MIKQLVKFMLWGLIAWVILFMTIDKVKAEEKFMASHMLAEQAANHTKVFNTFCK